MRRTIWALLLLFGWNSLARGEEASSATGDLRQALAELASDVFPATQRERWTAMVRDDQRRRLQQANDRSSTAWSMIDSRAAWERFRQPRLAALRRSLGAFPAPPQELPVRVTGKLAGDGFRIENLVFESRPGLWVTANLYLPAEPSPSMPGVLLCHSHHQPKEHGELQDMGMTWARGGCAVLVMDHLGHGERRQHPFASAEDYAGEFRPSRQDYYFRYDTGLQLHLAGESLLGWMAWDLMRGVDLLLARSGVDPQRIVLLGAVAGGGDPAAVAGALDERIAAVVPFNFGGPQPETRYPLPDDAETSFNYAGGGSWESTRNLRRSAADGFLPWVIVGGVAPRRLIYAHEFRWDRERDPVWRRLQQIYTFYDKPERLAFAHGYGELRGQPPEASHCTHIGRPHRVLIHAAFQRWFEIPVTPDEEYSARLDAAALHCLTDEAKRTLQPKSLHAVLTDLATERLAAARGRRKALPLSAQRVRLREEWENLLGRVACEAAPQVALTAERQSLPGGVTGERLALETEPGVTVPLLLLRPSSQEPERLPVVVAVSQAGKAAFVRQRPQALDELLSAGIAVCLPDVRGVGETRTGGDRGRQSADTALSSTEQMLGGTMVGARLRDVRAVLQYLRGREDIDPRRIALWGDSFAEANAPETNFRVPHGVAERPRQSEPLGGLLALLAGLYEDEIAATYVSGGLVEFQPALTSPWVLIPHDAVVPGVLTVGDLADVAAALAPRPLRLHGLVDHLNRRGAPEQTQQAYALAGQAYQQAGKVDAFSIAPHDAPPARWLIRHLTPEDLETP